nr:hypothetical protein L203_00513 [Cryptococcus depauperatus CBS 7841]
MGIFQFTRHLATQKTSSAPLTLQSLSPFIRSRHPPSSVALVRPDDFIFYPNYLSEEEQEVLIGLGLWKLERSGTVSERRSRRRKKTEEEGEKHREAQSGLQRLFSGNYGFEQGHYDSVIHHYRETLFSSLPPHPPPSLISTLIKIYSLFPLLPEPFLREPATNNLPPQGTITHFLHLAPEGEILGHIDNLGASGKVILGVSLGGERTMRLSRRKEDGDDGWDVRLSSGSVYIQRDCVRYNYEHAILPYGHEGSIWDGKRLEKGHRLSIMVRDAPTRSEGL